MIGVSSPVMELSFPKLTSRMFGLQVAKQRISSQSLCRLLQALPSVLYLVQMHNVSTMTNCSIKRYAGWVSMMGKTG